MGVLWERDGSPLTPWKSHGSTMEASWRHHGSAVDANSDGSLIGAPWEHHGCSTTVTRSDVGSPMEASIPWEFMGVPWEPCFSLEVHWKHYNAMKNLRKSHGIAAEAHGVIYPWRYDGTLVLP